MINNEKVSKLLDDKYDLKHHLAKGISVNVSNNDVVISGSRSDLVELADYIVGVALSSKDNDHVHIDDLTLINDKSCITNLIIEKNDK